MNNGLSNGHHIEANLMDKKGLHTATPVSAPTDAVDNNKTDPSLAWKYTGKEYKNGEFKFI